MENRWSVVIPSVVTGTAAGKTGGAGKFTIGRSNVNVVEPLSIVIWIVTLTNVPRSGTSATRMSFPVKSRMTEP